MSALPRPAPDPSASPSPAAAADSSAGLIPASRGEEYPAGPGLSPAHQLWETLESAYAAAEEQPSQPRDARLPGYIALPVVLGLSLGLWAVIIGLVLML